MTPNFRPPNIHQIITILRERVRDMTVPIVTEISQTREPFEVLVSTILSLRTKDEVTREASKRLFEMARTPIGLLELPVGEIADLIFPVGFYKTKAETLRRISQDLITHHDGKVPDDIDELLKLKGVGRKTANLVVALGYGKPGLCVDTHVHRISNRFGYVNTRNPEETEMALRAKLPRQYWMEYNDLLVTWGQNVCKPVSPFCSKCPITSYCNRVGVNRSR